MATESISLQAESRTVTGKKVKTLRRRGFLPAVVYGRAVTPQSLTVEAKSFDQVLARAGTSALVDLTIGEAKPVKVIIQPPSRHHLTDAPIHADFYAVKMDQEIETTVPLKFGGKSFAVEEQEGNLIISKDELQVRCLPANLVPEIEVDLSVLKTFDDSIRVSDLNVPATIEVLHEPEEVVVSVTPPLTEEELATELETDTEAEKQAVEALEEKPDEETPAPTEEKSE